MRRRFDRLAAIVIHRPGTRPALGRATIVLATNFVINSLWCFRPASPS